MEEEVTGAILDSCKWQLAMTALSKRPIPTIAQLRGQPWSNPICEKGVESKQTAGLYLRTSATSFD